MIYVPNNDSVNYCWHTQYLLLCRKEFIVDKNNLVEDYFQVLYNLEKCISTINPISTRTLFQFSKWRIIMDFDIDVLCTIIFGTMRNISASKNESVMPGSTGIHLYYSKNFMIAFVDKNIMNLTFLYNSSDCKFAYFFIDYVWIIRYIGV
jgi:hypothetical protein